MIQREQPCGHSYVEDARLVRVVFSQSSENLCDMSLALERVDMSGPSDETARSDARSVVPSSLRTAIWS